MTKESSSKSRYGLPSIRRRSVSVCYHCRAGANMYEIGSGGFLFQPSDQHCYIRALTASIGMQFVEYKKPQTSAHAVKKTLILRTDQNVFRHHIIREHDLGRVL